MKTFLDYYMSLRLKEIGFTEECLGYYTEDCDLVFNDDLIKGGSYERHFISHNCLPSGFDEARYVDCPMVWQVIEWLREKHNIHIVITPHINENYKVYYTTHSIKNPNDDIQHELDMLSGDIEDIRYYSWSEAATTEIYNVLGKYFKQN